MVQRSIKTFLPWISFTILAYLILFPHLQLIFKALLKPLPILLLLVYVLQLHLHKSTKLPLILALSSSMLGDIALTNNSNLAVQLAIIAFMITHTSYLVVFMKKATFLKKSVYAFSILLLVALSGLIYLWPYLGEMRYLVTLYTFVLIGMVFSTFQISPYNWLLCTGALFFILSDFVVALELFVTSNVYSIEVLSIFTYYIAQYMLILGSTQNFTDK